MFNSLAGTQTPNVQFWDFSRTGYTTSPSISLEDDCAPIQYIAVGGVSAVNINLYLPTNPYNGKTITIRCDAYAGNQQQVLIYDSSNRNSNLLITIGEGQTVQLCYVVQQTLVGGGATISVPISSNWVSIIGPSLQASSTQYSVTDGHNNANVAWGSTISGGVNNTVSSQYSFVGGGYANNNANAYTTVVGGSTNSTSSAYGFIGGGYNNNTNSVAGVSYCTIVGGTGNSMTAWANNGNWTPGASFIGGGISNYVGGAINSYGGQQGTCGVVVGGVSNQISANANQYRGYGSFIGGGYSNSILFGAANVIPGGSSNSISSDGINNVISGGGYNVITGGSYAAIIGGGYGTNRGINGITVFSGGTPIATAVGINQSSLLMLGKQTTDASNNVLTSDGGAAGTTNQLILPNSSAFYFKGRVIGTVTGGGDTKAWVFEGVIKRGAAVTNTSIVGSISNNVVAQDTNATSWVLTLSADIVNGGLAVSVRGAAGVTIRWACKIETDEVTF